jgi:hypothetical protein
MEDTEQGTQATIADVTFEHNLVPWAGRKYEPWLRGWARRHPVDPVGLVQVPESIYKAFQSRTPGERLGRRQATELGYPHVPGEQELEKVRRELHEALGRCDWDRAHDLDQELRALTDQVAARRVTSRSR